MRKIVLIAILLISCGEHGFYTEFPVAQDEDKVFYGDSITYGCNPDGLNRAIRGSGVKDVLSMVRYYDSYDGEAEYYILIGINDILFGDKKAYIYNLNRVFGYLKGKKVTITSILPTSYPEVNETVHSINSQIQSLAEIFGVVYIDKYSEMADGDAIKKEYTSDGIHLTDLGCSLLFNK